MLRNSPVNQVEQSCFVVDLHLDYERIERRRARAHLPRDLCRKVDDVLLGCHKQVSAGGAGGGGDAPPVVERVPVVVAEYRPGCDRAARSLQRSEKRARIPKAAKRRNLAPRQRRGLESRAGYAVG